MHKPFAVLEHLIREAGITLTVGAVYEPPSFHESGKNGRSQTAPTVPPPEFPPDLSGDALFEYAMKDVKQLGWSAVPLHPRLPLEIQPQDDEKEALRVLEEFLRNGDTAIEQTAEYIEGSVHPAGRQFVHA